MLDRTAQGHAPRLGLRLALVFVLGATAVAGAGASDTSQARMRPLLLVSSDRSGTEQLYAVSLDGRALRPLTHGPTPASFESASPDGRHFVYSKGNWNWLVRADGRGRRRIGGGTAVWAPDSHALALFSELGPFRILNADGRRLVSSPLEVDLEQEGVWSPTSRALAFAPGYWSSVIETVGADGSDRRPSVGDATTSVGDSAWTADGRSVAYTRFGLNDPGSISQIYVSRNGSKPARLAPMRGAEDVAAWSPDGQWLVFERVIDDDHSQLWLTRPDGSELHRLTHGAFDELATWTPEGDLVFNRAADGDSPTWLYEVHADGSGLHRLQAPANVWGASLAPDGSRFVATVQKGDEKYGIGLFARDGKRLRMLAPVKDSWLPMWSPSGGSIAFVRNGRIAVMQPNGSGLRFLTDGEHESDDDPAWVGDRIAFDVLPSEDEDGVVLDLLDTRSGQVRTLARDAEPDSTIAWSRDGNAIAYTNSTQLNLREVSTGRLLGSVAGDFSIVDDLHWAPGGTRLFVEVGNSLLTIDRSGRRVSRLRIPGTPTWSPNGRWATWSQPGRRGSRLMLFDGRTRRLRVLARLHGGVDEDAIAWNATSTLVAVAVSRSPVYAGLGDPLTFSSFAGRVHDAYVVTRATGRVRRVTRRYPGGGDNEPAAWLRARRPPPAPHPAVTGVRPQVLARGPKLLALSADGDRLAYAFGGRFSRCSGIHVRDIGSRRDVFAFNPCAGGNDLSAVQAGAGSVAWALQHSGGGAGDSDYGCLYATPVGVPPRGINRRTSCTRDENPRKLPPFEGDLEALAGAGGLTVGGVGEYCDHDKDICPRYKGFLHALVRLDPHRVTPIVHTTRTLDLMDVDQGSILARLDDRILVVYNAAGAIQRVLRPGGRIIAARLDGSTVVVLRGRLLEQWALWSGRRLARIRIRGRLDQVILRDAGGGLAAYTEGAVVHVARFADGRDAAVWVPRLSVAPKVLLTPSGLVVGAQLEGGTAIVGLVRQAALVAAFRRT